VDEDDLADAFRTGSAEGVRAVYERYSGAVFTIALRVLGDRELAADATQVTFLNAWRACGTLEPGRPLAPWLFTIARRAAIDLYRRAHGPEPVEPKDDATIALPPSMECIWEAWQIRIALDMLPAEEREVVRAQHFAGLTHAQIAQQLAMPIGTVKSRSHRAHRRLASMLGHLAEVAA
jgi:RNA polymerase sigma factor (sigma-70 family)